MTPSQNISDRKKAGQIPRETETDREGERGKGRVRMGRKGSRRGDTDYIHKQTESRIFR